jgi:hypothetical protein
VDEFGDVIDEDVEFALFGADALDEGFYLFRVGVIDGGGGALSAARGDHGGGFVDGFGSASVVERRDFLPAWRGMRLAVVLRPVQ